MRIQDVPKVPKLKQQQEFTEEQEQKILDILCKDLDKCV